ncbi:transcription repressor OFP14 [Corylus avellana]|uniref:transcription repressor OFP14 n=1 Tax=Corylus avellana TaxID=13451 RepID=UPI00286D3470|nr:transcription repressor OFP14 [Corylus avellana]
MPKKLQKSLQGYLTKIKKPTPRIQFPSNNSFSSSKNWILSGCKHPKTLSFAMDHNQEKARKNDDADGKKGGGEVTLSDVDRFLFENFKSLYIEEDEDNYNEKKGKANTTYEGENPSSGGGVLVGSPRFTDLPPDLCGSHRFFISPSVSSSLIEESRTSVMSEDPGSSSISTTITLNDSTTSTTTTNDHAKDRVTLPDDCIAVLVYSPTPYEDFQQSMQEMVEARLRNHHGKVDWSFMEELLFSYLNLNEKKSYKYILSAFADLIVVLRQDSSEKVPVRSRNVERERRMKRREK